MKFTIQSVGCLLASVYVQSLSIQRPVDHVFAGILLGLWVVFGVIGFLINENR